jgi:hypothetical protein
MRIGKWGINKRRDNLQERDGYEDVCLALWEEFRDIEMKELKIV